jgi:hypothetical protein
VYLYVAAMKTESGDLTTKATARILASNFCNGDEGKSRTAAECLIHVGFLFSEIQLTELACLVELRLPVAHFGWLATDSLGFCDQSTHFPEERSSAGWSVAVFSSEAVASS